MILRNISESLKISKRNMPSFHRGEKEKKYNISKSKKINGILHES